MARAVLKTADIRCPFFRGGTTAPDLRIRCEGLYGAGSSIVQVFRERADFNAQLRFCTARSYETCEIYRAVMNAAWGEEWEEMQQCRCRTRK